MSRWKRRRDTQRRHHEHRPQTYWAPPGELQEVVEDEEIERLAYTRKQAAEALGVSVSTIDRHLVKVIDTVKTPWGQRLIPAAGIERFLHEHLEPARQRAARRPAGRPATLPRSVVERIRLEYLRGRALADIARGLMADGVPTAHGGRQWWRSTVRAVLIRAAR